MEWIAWLYLLYFTVLWSAGFLWGLDEILAARVVVTGVVSLHFIAGGITALRGGRAAVAARYSLAGGLGWVNIFADALLLAAIPLAWFSETLLFISAGFATVGNSFCLLGHIITPKKGSHYLADLGGGIKVQVRDVGDGTAIVKSSNFSGSPIKLNFCNEKFELENVFSEPTPNNNALAKKDVLDPRSKKPPGAAAKNHEVGFMYRV